jgi:PAS domain S-box-containing protein
MTSPLQVLILEDNPSDAELVQQLLDADNITNESRRVQTRPEFVEALQAPDLDLILADYSLPTFDGFTALNLARTLRPEVPFIFVSGSLGEEVAIEALKIGATDYVLKSRLSRLVPAVQRALRETRERNDRRKAEDAARRSEKELLASIDIIPAIAFTTLPDGSAIWANRQWGQFTGLSPQDTSGFGWQATLHPDDLDNHLAKWRRSLSSGEPFENEARHRGAKGEYRYFLVRAVPLRDENEKIVKWFGTLTDIEDRKRAEQERERLRQLESDLAYMSRVMTMGELAASITHEIKQPITAAVMNAEACARWLSRDVPNVSEASHAAAAMVAGAMRAAEIVDRVRSLYVREAPRREPFYLGEIIQEILILLAETAKRNLVCIRTDIKVGSTRAIGDRVQVQQVLLNLMLNSIEAMKDTGGDLTVSSMTADDGLVQVHVSDTGPGLPIEQSERLFEAFFTTKPQGTGLGLCISRRIVEAHGGRLWASSNQGRGVTFHFTLPAEISAHSGGVTQSVLSE